MKSKFKYAVLFALIAGVAFTGCKDEEEEETPAPTKKEMLTGNNWVVFELTITPAIDYDGNGTQETDLIPFQDACDLDDFTDWNADNTYTVEEGPTKCDPNASQVYETGTWAFNSDETIIINTTAGGSSYEQPIQSLSSGQLVFVETFVEDGVTYTLTAKYN